MRIPNKTPEIEVKMEPDVINIDEDPEEEIPDDVPEDIPEEIPEDNYNTDAPPPVPKRPFRKSFYDYSDYGQLQDQLSLSQESDFSTNASDKE